MSAASYESLAWSLTLGINNALFTQPFVKYGQDAAKPHVFERFLKHQSMGGLMITEPGFGSDALSMQTSVTETDGKFQLKGKKHWQGLTGMAEFWLLTGRRKAENGTLMRDVEMFVCDVNAPNQNITVDEYYENLGLYQIPYGLNNLDVTLPAESRLIPQTTGVKMLLDLLHRSRFQFPGMGLGFLQRMLDEAIAHVKTRIVSNKNLLQYDQVQHRLARLQANFSICSAFCHKSGKVADIENDLFPLGLEANIIKTVTTDMMQDSSQSLLQLVGGKGYRLNHIAGRSTVDSRPFQIFEGSNDILYHQIADLQKLFQDEGITFRKKSRKIDSMPGFIRLEKFFYFDSYGEQMFIDKQQMHHGYFVIEHALSWENFSELTREVKFDTHLLFFDAALAYYQQDGHITQLVRIYKEQLTKQSLIEIKQGYSKLIGKYIG